MSVRSTTNKPALTSVQPTNAPKRVHRIEIRLRDVAQLFNTMDPSPFHEKDLDADAEEFILSWAEEFPIDEPTELVIHVPQAANIEASTSLVETAFRNYFQYRARLMRRELRRLMRDARTSLLIGGTFLCTCLIASNLLVHLGTGAWQEIVRESLTIVGWVAMWRPLQMYLYDWWPIRRRIRIYEKMSRIAVRLLVDATYIPADGIGYDVPHP